MGWLGPYKAVEQSPGQHESTQSLQQSTGPQLQATPEISLHSISSSGF